MSNLYDDCVERSIASLVGDGPNSFQSLVERGILSPSGTLTPSAAQFAAAPAAAPKSMVYDIYVEPDLRGEITVSLDRYVSDLTSEGYSVTVQDFAGTAAQLRSTLHDRWTNADLEGALFIGDLPTVSFKSIDGYSSGNLFITEYVHDLYFMDLDGEYVFNETGPDEHVAGNGDVGPEIYVSRLYPSTVENVTGESESAAINAFLDKVHAVRQGDITFEDKAIAFLDDDWAGFDAESFLSPLYTEIVVINDRADTTASNYLQVLGMDAETLLETIHSNPFAHFVRQPTGSGFVSNVDIAAANPQAGFINMFNCSSGDFTVPGNLIGTYAFASDRTSNAVASTKTGSMLNFEQFYGPLAEGISMGEAFLRWFDVNAGATDDPSQSWKVDWFNGMTMHGDPTLAPALLPSINDSLPALSEGEPVAESVINGVDRSQMVISSSGNAAISFVDEVAAFQSSLGVYLVGSSGEIVEPRWVFERIEHALADDSVSAGARPGGGPSTPGDVVLLSDLYDPGDLQEGTEFGLFLVADGAARNPFVVFDGGTLAFRTSSGVADVTDTTPRLVHIAENGVERIVQGEIMHTIDAGSTNPLSNTLNPGSKGQTLSGLLDGAFTVAFEDKPFNASDKDFNDVLVAVDLLDDAPALFAAPASGAEAAGAVASLETLLVTADTVA